MRRKLCDPDFGAEKKLRFLSALAFEFTYINRIKIFSDRDLTNVYAKTVQGAVVTVIVKELRSRPVYFIGGFGKPGVT